MLDENFEILVTLSKAIKRSYRSIKTFYNLELKSEELVHNSSMIEDMKTEILSTVTNALKAEFPVTLVSNQILGKRVPEKFCSLICLFSECII